MTREELLALVNKELGRTKLTLNERAINEELDDSLGDFGDDEAANAKLVTRIANRLKRMDGSVHSAVSHEVEEYKKNYKQREKPEEGPAKPKDNDGHAGDDNGASDSLKQMMAEWKELKETLQKEKAERTRKDLIASVRKGLEDKYEASEIALNPYFVNAAMSKLSVPEENVDVKSLVDEAERLYTAETKSAGIEFGRPAVGGQGSVGSHKEDEHEFDDIAARRKRYNPNPTEN